MKVRNNKKQIFTITAVIRKYVYDISKDYTDSNKRMFKLYAYSIRMIMNK